MIEFLGNKTRLLPFLLEHIGASAPRGSRVADLFCGTASVSAGLDARGYRVIASDHLELCCTFAEATLLRDTPAPFADLARELGITACIDHYAAVVQYLNRLPGQEGFIHGTYSPASMRHAGVARMYFTRSNARRIDAIRAAITELSPYLSRNERAILLRDLVQAAVSVSNTAGTFGCYMKHWKPRALKTLRLSPGTLRRSPAHHQVLCGEASSLAPHLNADVVYADPPYTKRQYAAYYHILETIVLGDSPDVTGSTGLRPWHAKRSEFCYRKTAARALETLVSKLRCEMLFLSYSDEGQVAHETVCEILAAFGAVSVHETNYQRYRSNTTGSRRSHVTERLYKLTFN